jgi:hypothetical protein
LPNQAGAALSEYGRPEQGAGRMRYREGGGIAKP